MKRRTALTVVALLSLGINVQAQEHGHGHNGAKAPVKKQQTEWGIAGDPEAVTRTIRISMTDNMRFTPDKIDVKQGDVVKFLLTNDGKLLHEFVIGTKPELDKLAALVIKSPDQVDHERSDRIHVEPGKVGEVVWNFNRAGAFDFACLLPGHYQAGMVGRINVATMGKK